MSTQTLIEHNVAYLAQALSLLDELGDEQYTETRPPFFTSGIGDHLRHIIEHYQCFIAGQASGSIDYDGRKRDREIATDRAHAAAIIQDIVAGLRHGPGTDAPVDVRLDGSPDSGDVEPWSRSTIRRELQYLQAHTVHHYALIAFIMRLQGDEPSPEFGVAPSTLRHRKGLADASAR